MYSLTSNSMLQLKFTLRNAKLDSYAHQPDNLLSSTRRSGLIVQDGHEIVAEFSAMGDGLAFTGKFSPKYSSSSLLPVETQTYRNVVGMIVGQLRTLEREESAADLRAEIKREIEQVMISFESSLQAKGRARNIRPVKLPSNSTKLNNGQDLNRQASNSITSANHHSLTPSGVFSNRNDGVVDLFGEDFDYKHSFRGLVSNRSRAGDPIFYRQLSAQPIQFRLFEESNYDPLFISGFLGLEIEEHPPAAIPEGLRAFRNDLEFMQALRSSFKLLSPLSIQHDTRGTLVRANFSLRPDLLPKSEVFLHWGRYSDSLNFSPWTDDEILIRDIIQCGDGSLYVEKEIKPDRAGDYGVTMFVRQLAGSEKVWAGASGISDAQFSFSQNQISPSLTPHRQPLAQSLMFRGMLQQAVADYDIFIQNIYQLAKKVPVHEVQRGLLEITRDEPDLQVLLSKYYARARRECPHQTGLAKKKRELALSVLDNLGIGSVVFISPEGPHAIAGGLAQMIAGITACLARRKIGVTLITPLYEESQGNKHKAAEEIIQEGISLQGERVDLRYIGQVNVKFGPIFRAGEQAMTSPQQTAAVLVYAAEADNMRVLFLRHRRYANRLYPTEWADQQLMKAIFLSRGALEVIKDPKFGIDPSIIVTNDWLAGLTQVLLQTDPLYLKDPFLRQCSTMHIIHNGGKDYQGRIPLNQFGEDLWPLLGIGGEHVAGLTDEHEAGFLNITRGAVFHTQGAIVAVSKPYAEQLLTPAGGEGLDTTFRLRRNKLVGISNGIDVEAIRSLYFQLGECARQEFGETPAKVRPSSSKFLQKIFAYKRATKGLLQRKYNLEQNPDLFMISLVGRLAEQKGIRLLSDMLDGVSLLERILISNPDVQIVIGGPVSRGDPVGEQIRTLLKDLEFRYPLRIRGIIDFIKHREALSITLASDLFLMPSRFEPGGITQLEALAAGTLVIARNVGGLAATLKNYSDETGKGDSFLFDDYNPTALMNALQSAITAIKDPDKRERLVINASKSEHDWNFRLPKYLTLFQHITGALSLSRHYRYLYDKLPILDTIKVHR